MGVSFVSARSHFQVMKLIVMRIWFKVKLALCFCHQGGLDESLQRSSKLSLQILNLKLFSWSLEYKDLREFQWSWSTCLRSFLVSYSLFTHQGDPVVRCVVWVDERSNIVSRRCDMQRTCGFSSVRCVSQNCNLCRLQSSSILYSSHFVCHTKLTLISFTTVPLLKKFFSLAV